MDGLTSVKLFKIINVVVDVGVKQYYEKCLMLLMLLLILLHC